MLGTVKRRNMWSISPPRAGKRLLPSFSLHYTERWGISDWELKLKSPDNGFLWPAAWTLEWRVASGWGPLAPLLVPRAGKRPCRRATKTNKTRDERFPERRTAGRYLTAQKKTWALGRRMQMMFLWVFFILFQNYKRERGRERGWVLLEQKWERRVICLFPCYLWVQLCHFTFNIQHSPIFSWRTWDWNHNHPSL